MLAIAGIAFGNSNTWLQLKLSNGHSVSYLVSGKMRLTFTDKDMVIKSDRLEAAYGRDAVLSYNFFEDIDTNTLVNQAMMSEVNVNYISRDEIEITGIDADQPVKVYSTNGTQLQPQIEHRQDGIVIKLGGQPNGVILISLPNSNVPAIKVVH